MKKWKPLSLAAFVAAVLALTGCGSTASSPGSSTNGAGSQPKLAAAQTVNLLEPSDVEGFDPNIADEEITITAISQIFDGLTRIGSDGVTPEKAIASSWDISSDGKTYTFHLRDAKWSDGPAVRAQDFVFGWKRELSIDKYGFIMNMIQGADAVVNLDPKASAAEKQAKLDAVGIKAIDDKTLQVQLTAPTTYFLGLTAFVPFYPAREDFVTKQGDKYGTSAATLISDGPMQLSDWKQGSSWAFVKNANYWDASKVQLTKANYTIVKDQSQAVNLYDTKKSDMVYMLNADNTAHYRGTPDYHELSIDANYYAEFNPNSSNAVAAKAFKNANIRKAFGESIDRATFVKTILNDGSKPATGLVPPTVPGDPKAAGDFRTQNGTLVKDNDPTTAKADLQKGLQEAGLTINDLNSIHFLTNDTSTAGKLAQLITQMWKQALGVTISIDTVPQKIRVDSQHKGNFDICFAGWGADYADAMTFSDLFTTGNSQNDTKYSNPQFDALIKQAKAEPDNSKRAQELEQAEKLMLADGYISPVYFKGVAVIQKPTLQGVSFLPLGPDYDLKNAFIAQ
ncbi:MAG: ABC-type oligopeptide transport system, periplasmic component [Bacilli bacterium]|nr:ABC-type oligopeptide transport system, periplasmic component [Bacilli bacterium]